MFRIKYIQVILITGMLIGLLILGAQYFVKSVSIVETESLLVGAKNRYSFFPKSEVEILGLMPTKTDIYSTDVFLFDNTKFSQPGISDYTSSVQRSTPRTDVATFALEEIVRGPTTAEIEEGMRPTFGEDNFVTISGKSQCGIRVFTLSVDPDAYFAKVNFCRDLIFHQDWSSKLLTSQIRKSLIQFDKIQKVQILNREGNCLDGVKPTTPEDCVY